MKSPLWISLSCLILGACSSFVEGNANSSGSQQRSSLRDHNPVGTDLQLGKPRPERRMPAKVEDDIEIPETEDWKQARGTILRTFAFRALERGLVEEARHYLQEACEIDPNDISSHAALSRLFLTEGDHRAALAYATRAHNAEPENPEIAVVMAAALSESNRADEGTELLEKVWKVNPGDQQFAQALLTHYAATGGHEMAREFIKNILDTIPDQAHGWALAGDQFLAEGSLEEAIEAYRKARELDPGISTPENLAEYFIQSDQSVDPVIASAYKAEQSNDLSGAERLYRFLIRSKPDNPKVQAGLARVLLAQNRAEEAQRVIEGIPMGVRSWREHLLAAKISIALTEWHEARGHLLVSLNQRPGVRASELLLHFVDDKVASMPKPKLVESKEEEIQGDTEASAIEEIEEAQEEEPEQPSE